MATAADVAAELRVRFARDPGVTKIHKLLYYCQGWHYLWTGEPMFPEQIQAWVMGPVVATLWRRERTEQEGSLGQLNELELRTVEYVFHRYGHLWATQLIGRTHQEDPWRLAWECGMNTELDLETMRDFFAADPAADQAWFWDPTWQEGEREATNDIKQGRVSTALSVDEFVARLAAHNADV